MCTIAHTHTVHGNLHQTLGCKQTLISQPNLLQNKAFFKKMKEIKVGQEGPMYTHNDFPTSACVRTCTAARNVKGACVLGLISKATYVLSIF